MRISSVVLPANLWELLPAADTAADMDNEEARDNHWERLPEELQQRIQEEADALMIEERRSLPRRLVKETQRLQSDPDIGVSAVPYQKNLRYFNVTIAGPNLSPYQEGIFKLELFVPEEYPMGPPKVRFLTKVYHPNIDKIGRIGLDILAYAWSPALHIRTVLLMIQALLCAPNPDDPLATDVGEHWKKNEQAAIATAKEWTRKYACNTASCTAASPSPARPPATGRTGRATRPQGADCRFAEPHARSSCPLA